MMNNQQMTSRRELLQKAGGGFGMLALASLMGATAVQADEPKPANGKPHHKPRAKSVIWLFMEGGPSGFDLFDPKPRSRETSEIIPKLRRPYLLPPSPPPALWSRVENGGGRKSAQFSRNSASTALNSAG